MGCGWPASPAPGRSPPGGPPGSPSAPTAPRGTPGTGSSTTCGSGGWRAPPRSSAPPPPAVREAALHDRARSFHSTVPGARRSLGPMDKTWDAAGYDRSFSFVTAGGAPVLELLAPRPGERILDLGCGTGELTERIAAAGAAVIGLDADGAMIRR